MNTIETEFAAALVGAKPKPPAPVMPLPKDTRIMSDEDWVINKSCAAKKRNHKWQWKHDKATNLPHPFLAICVHCGDETNLSRSGYGAA